MPPASNQPDVDRWPSDCVGPSPEMSDCLSCPCPDDEEPAPCSCDEGPAPSPEPECCSVEDPPACEESTPNSLDEPLWPCEDGPVCPCPEETAVGECGAATTTCPPSHAAGSMPIESLALACGDAARGGSATATPPAISSAACPNPIVEPVGFDLRLTPALSALDAPAPKRAECRPWLLDTSSELLCASNSSTISPSSSPGLLLNARGIITAPYPLGVRGSA
jgi:hypothetical protein